MADVIVIGDSEDEDIVVLDQYNVGAAKASEMRQTRSLTRSLRQLTLNQQAKATGQADKVEAVPTRSSRRLKEREDDGAIVGTRTRAQRNKSEKEGVVDQGDDVADPGVARSTRRRQDKAAAVEERNRDDDATSREDGELTVSKVPDDDTTKKKREQESTRAKDKKTQRKDTKKAGEMDEVGESMKDLSLTDKGSLKTKEGHAPSSTKEKTSHKAEKLKKAARKDAGDLCAAGKIEEKPTDETPLKEQTPCPESGKAEYAQGKTSGSEKSPPCGSDASPSVEPVETVQREAFKGAVTEPAKGPGSATVAKIQVTEPAKGPGSATVAKIQSHGIAPRCPMAKCDMLFSEEDKLKEHLKNGSHSPCNPLRHLLDGTMEATGTCFACPVCDKFFSSKDECVVHLNKNPLHNAGHPVQISCYLCPQCLSLFPDQAACSKHMISMRHTCFTTRLVSKYAYPVPVPGGLCQAYLQKCSHVSWRLECLQCDHHVHRNGRKHFKEHPVEAHASKTTVEVFSAMVERYSCGKCWRLFDTAMSADHPRAMHLCSDTAWGFSPEVARLVVRGALGPAPDAAGQPEQVDGRETKTRELNDTDMEASGKVSAKSSGDKTGAFGHSVSAKDINSAGSVCSNEETSSKDKTNDISKEKTSVSSHHKTSVSSKDKITVSSKDKSHVSSKDKTRVSPKVHTSASSKDRFAVSSKDKSGVSPKEHTSASSKDRFTVSSKDKSGASSKKEASDCSHVSSKVKNNTSSHDASSKDIHNHDNNIKNSTCTRGDHSTCSKENASSCSISSKEKTAKSASNPTAGAKDAGGGATTKEKSWNTAVSGDFNFAKVQDAKLIFGKKTRTSEEILAVGEQRLISLQNPKANGNLKPAKSFTGTRWDQPPSAKKCEKREATQKRAPFNPVLVNQQPVKRMPFEQNMDCNGSKRAKVVDCLGQVGSWANLPRGFTDRYSNCKQQQSSESWNHDNRSYRNNGCQSNRYRNHIRNEWNRPASRGDGRGGWYDPFVRRAGRVQTPDFSVYEIRNKNEVGSDPEGLESKKHILFLDLDNWQCFFSRLPGLLPTGTFVWAFWGGGTNWREPWSNRIFLDLKERRCFHLHTKCGNSKDSADFAMTLHAGRMDEKLPKHIPFTILSGDTGFVELERQLKSTCRKSAVINPHRLSTEAVYELIVYAGDIDRYRGL